MAYTRTWNAANEASPADADQRSQGALAIRNLKIDVRERLAKDHYFDITGTDTDHGEHTKVTLRTGTAPTHAANKIKLYAKDVSDKAELFCIDEDGDEIQLTSSGKMISDIPSGTKMLIYADEAPTGWTIDATMNDKMVFITKGSGEDGETGGEEHSTGTWTQPTHTHTGPSHTHTGPSHTHTGPSHTHTFDDGGHTHSVSSHTHSIDSSHTHTTASHVLTTDEIPAHTHNIEFYEGGSGDRQISRYNAFKSGYQGTQATKSAGGGVAHGHGNTGSGGGAKITGSGGNGTTVSTHASGATGAGGTGATGAGGTGATGAGGTGETSASATAATWRPAGYNFIVCSKN